MIWMKWKKKIPFRCVLFDVFIRLAKKKKKKIFKKKLNSAHINIKTGNRKFRNWQNSIEIFFYERVLFSSLFLGESCLELNSDSLNIVYAYIYEESIVENDRLMLPWHLLVHKNNEYAFCYLLARLRVYRQKLIIFIRMQSVLVG